MINKQKQINESYMVISAIKREYTPLRMCQPFRAALPTPTLTEHTLKTHTINGP